MSGTIWSKFFWSDWESDPALRLCSFAAQGFWMRVLRIAAAHDRISYVAVVGKGLDETALSRQAQARRRASTSLQRRLHLNRRHRARAQRRPADRHHLAVATTVRGGHALPRGFPLFIAGRRQADGVGTARRRRPIGGGIADRILSAGRAYADATRAMAHWEVSGVVQKVCCAGESVKSLAEQSGEPRDVVTKLLKIGLDILAVHYGMMLMRKPR